MTRLERYECQLESINQAILAIETGAQEYRIGNRLARRGDLATLYKERTALENKIDRLAAAERNGGTTYVANFRRS